ncbi:MAG: arginine N-succinyltransferase [Chlamydiales bacterium]
MEDIALFRAATLKDLDTLIQFSQEAGAGITSLPRDPKVLEERLKDAHRSFHQWIRVPKHEMYLFCLEWKGKVIGASGIISRIALGESFYAYHLLNEKHRSEHLKIDRNISALHFIQARKKPTEIGTLFIKRENRQQGFGKLLSFSRFLFMATFRYRFAPVVIAELRGFHVEGSSPFWDAIGRPFFDIDFSAADLLRTTHPECIQEIFPKHPIYPLLLPQEVQEVIGKSHPYTLPAQKMLEKQGFKMSRYVDIFDGGPHLYASTDEIHAVRASREGKVKEMRSHIDGSKTAIVSNQKLDFRACLAHIIEDEYNVILHPSVADTLQVDIGDPIRYYPL